MSLLPKSDPTQPTSLLGKWAGPISAGYGLYVPAAAGLFLAEALRPRLYTAWAREDGWVEWATFALFVFGAALAIGALRTSARRIDRFAFALLALFCVFVAGEEISWGQRILGFTPPEVFLEHNYQQEANLHNFLKGILDTRWMVFMIGVGYGAILPLLARRADVLRPLAPALWLAPAFIFVSVLEATYPFELTGEVAEMLLGLAFVSDIVERRQRVAPQTNTSISRWMGAPRLSLGLQLAGLLVAFALGAVVDRLAHGDSEEAVAGSNRELATLARDVLSPSVARPKLFRKRRVHKRMFTAVRARYFKFGRHSKLLEGERSPAELIGAGPERKDRLGYFLDPWQQPYWVLYERGKDGDRRMLLYSFGPNRRRDSDLRRLEGRAIEEVLAGDDLGVFLTLDPADEHGVTLSARP